MESTIQKVKVEKEKEKQIALDRQQRQLKALQLQNDQRQDGMLSPMKSRALDSESMVAGSTLAATQWKTYLEATMKSQQLNGN